FNIAEEQISEVYDINSVNDLEIEGGDIKLRGYDVIIVRKNPGYRSQVNVSVEGEVFFPGAYVLKTKNERVSNVIKRAGGLTPQAFDKGVYITRVNNKTGANELNSQKINKIQETLNDTANVIVQAMERKVDQIAINLGAILDRPGGQDDLILEEGDVITIPKEKMDVRISGQVLFPTRVIFDEQLNLKDYLGRAGGVAENARKGKIYVLYPNGNAAKTGHFLFFRRYPKVAAGSEVIVPKKHEVERRRLSTGEVIGITTAITSFAGVLLSVLINSK
ncbi:MAG TPA: SLBB domain-containing protein, partial [Segetibacter sp.]